MKAQITIRRATKKDMKALLNLDMELSKFLRKISPFEVDLEKCKKVLEKEYKEKFKKKRRNWFVLAAELKNKIVGFSKVYIIKDTYTNEKYYGIIGNVFVKEKYRKRGIASLLLKESMRILREKGVKNIGIRSDIKNTKAIKIWKSLGFKEYSTDFIKKI